MSGGENGADNSWGGWFANVQGSIKDLAHKTQEAALATSKIVQEKASTVAQQANELRQQYDMEVATSILMNSMGVPESVASVNAESEKRAVAKTKSAKLDLAYVTENLISMAFPYDWSDPPKNVDGANDIDIVSKFLRKRHSGHFMIWNISEEGYDYAKFDNQVLEYKFPGHPSPPLGLLFKICTSIESWLDADEQNVAVIHCLTGKGRTAALMACVLTWIGEFNSPMEALQYVADRRNISVEHLTIPSQRRYVQYFSNMLDGVKPRSEPLLLRRVIMNSIPIFGKNSEGEGSEGCCPYIQLFKNGNLIATAAPVHDSHATAGDDSDDNAGAAAVAVAVTGGGISSSKKSHVTQKMQLRWINASEGSVSFTVDCPIQGDILLRCRHTASSGARVSCFRAAFHTGYAPSGVLRLTKAQLDGSSTDERFDEDFFIDLIFAPITASTDGSRDAAADSGAAAAVGDAGLTLDAVSADKYELTLHKDARFWEGVNSRRQKIKKRRSRKYVSQLQEVFKISEDDEPGSPTTGDISFAPKTGSGVGGQLAATGSKASGTGLSDEDLIAQLSNLDAFMDEASNDSGGAKTEDSGGFEILSSKPSVNSELQALEELEKELGLGDLSMFGPGDSSTSTSVATPAKTPLVGAAPAAVPATPAAANVPLTPMSASSIATDELDDLEMFLNNLSTSSS